MHTLEIMYSTKVYLVVYDISIVDVLSPIF